MVRNAPFLADVMADLIAFVGDAPVLGHNVTFDLTFLRQAGALKQNIEIDTYELAAVLMPTASRYNLSALAQQLGVLLPATHRALDDARATHGVFVELIDKAHQLPLDLLAELVRLGEPLDWQANWALQQVLRQRASNPSRRKRRPGEHMAHYLRNPMTGVTGRLVLNPARCSWISTNFQRSSSRAGGLQPILMNMNIVHSRLKCCEMSPWPSKTLSI